MSAPVPDWVAAAVEEILGIIARELRSSGEDDAVEIAEFYRIDFERVIRERCPFKDGVAYAEVGQTSRERILDADVAALKEKLRHKEDE